MHMKDRREGERWMEDGRELEREAQETGIMQGIEGEFKVRVVLEGAQRWRRINVLLCNRASDPREVLEETAMA